MLFIQGGTVGGGLGVEQCSMGIKSLDFSTFGWDLVFPLEKLQQPEAVPARALGFFQKQQELSFPAARAWHGWLHPFQHSSSVSWDVSFHPAVKNPPPSHV